MSNKICSSCKKEKPLEDFTKCKKSKDGRTSRCKECTNIYNRENGLNKYSSRAEYAIAWQRKFRQTEKYKEYDKEYRELYHSTFSGVVTRLLCAARNRAKKNGQEIDIDRQWIIERLTPMKCEATGVDLVLLKDKDVQHTPFKPSIDRIDNNKGYLKENCRIVAVIYNKTKSDYKDEDVLKMARALMEKHK